MDLTAHERWSIESGRDADGTAAATADGIDAGTAAGTVAGTAGRCSIILLGSEKT